MPFQAATDPTIAFGIRSFAMAFCTALDHSQCKSIWLEIDVYQYCKRGEE